MGIPDTTVGNVLRARDEGRDSKAKKLADMLEEQVKAKGAIDVGKGVELELQDIFHDPKISKGMKDTAIEILRQRGYEVQNLKVEQAFNPSQYTTVQVVTLPEISKASLYKDLSQIKPVNVYSQDGGETYEGFQRPVSVDSKRIFIRYGEDGGAERDGTIELRRGVEDISLGDSHYAQVRIGVDDKAYMKGMAFYSDNIPDGYDIVYNSNKPKGTPYEKVFKSMEKDKNGNIIWENPFGADIKRNGQSYYDDENGKYIDPVTKKKQSLRAINKLREEGDWERYSKTLPSQFLSKQPRQLIKQQLSISEAEQRKEFDDIVKLTNPSIKEKLLLAFADNCDAAAVHLKAASLPRQASKVILPVSTLKDDEIYAPSFKNGEKVVLIRYPHAGIFEIPLLTVNNKHADGARIVGKDAIDAVGINIKVAQKLSGADFDGDTVTIIPVNSKVKIQTRPSLEKLNNFDPVAAFPGYEGMKKMTKKQRGIEMGSVSNLITDMTLLGADDEELSRAVRHSMVVIDAYKHGLDWKSSEKEFAIKALKAKYQGGERAGASTLISRAKGVEYVPQRKQGQMKIDPKTGKKIYFETGNSYRKYERDKKTGEIKLDSQGNPIFKEIMRQTKSTHMAETDDARKLIKGQGTIQENLYADYANALKALANTARKEAISIKYPKTEPSLKKVYSQEIDSLKAKLNIAKKNAPRERMAQLEVNQKVSEWKDMMEGLEYDADDLKKVKNVALASARVKYGADKSSVMVDITEKEWEAIQSGAISKTLMKDILDNTDLDKVKEYATPRNDNDKLSNAQIGLIKSMHGTYTLKEIADRLNISASTVSKYLKE